MKNFKRILLIISVLCLLFTATAFAACRDNKEATATLTLNDGGGGTLSAATLQVKVGSNIAEAVSDVTVDPDSGLTFAGWHNGTDMLSQEDVMPAGGLTLTAKYNASYTLNVYYAFSQESYPDTPSEVITGYGRFGEPFTVDTSELLGQADTQRGGRLSTDALGKNEVFTAYRVCVPMRVNFDPNSDDPNLTRFFVDYIKGGKAILPDGSNFPSASDVRFAGWATTANGKTEYEAGDAMDTSNLGYSVTLYAKWEQGVSDLFGGSDYLFVSSVHSNTVYMRRRGLEEKTGTYNPDSGLFTFEEAGEVRLEGKITADGFYYFDDLRGRTITNGFDSNEKLTFDGGDSVTLVYAPQGTSETVRGTLKMDALTGEYVFESSKITFKFSVNTVTDGDGNRSLVFNRPRGTESGFYYDNASNSVLYLDGMVDANGIGGLIVFALDENGKLSSALRAFYFEWEDLLLQDDSTERPFYLFDKTYAVITASSDSPMFLFRIADGNEQTLGGEQIRGTYKVSDGVSGHYFENAALSSIPNLLLDGFGNVKFDPEGGDNYSDGTYEIGHLDLPIVQDDGTTYTWTDLWVKLTINGETTYRVVYSSDSMPQHAEVSVLPSLTKWANPLSKTYGVQPSGATGAYLFQSSVYGAYVYAEITTQDNSVYYYVVDNGIVTENDDGTYRFTSRLYGSGDDYVYWDFRYDDNDQIQTGLVGYENITFEGGQMSFDKWGTITYNGKTYPYDKWTATSMPAHIYGDNDAFHLEIYTLTEGENTVSLLVRVDEHVEGEQTVQVCRVIELDSVTDIVWKQFYGQTDYFDKLYLIDDTHAAIALLYDDGLYHFVIYGTYSYDEQTHEYTFTADEQLIDDFVAEIGDKNLVESYSDFRFVFQTEGGKKTALKYIYESDLTSKTGDRFQIDGYGNATFTPNGGQSVSGTYQAIDHYGKYYFEFVSEDKTQTHRISVTYNANDEFEDFLVDAEGAGLYYLIYDTGGIYLDTYLVLLGDCTDDQAGTAIAPGEVGTYQPTGVTVNYSGATFAEYKVVLIGIDAEGKPYEDEMHVAIGTVTVTENNDDQEKQVDYNCFVIRADPQADRHFDVVGGGKIEGDGYNDSTYTDKNGNIYYGLIGIGYIDDSTPIMSNYHWHDDFEKGKNVIFRATYAFINDNYYEGTMPFLFDVLDNGKLSLRDDYNATYALYQNGNITQSTLYLDGHGNAVLRDEGGNVTDSGKYSYIPGLECMLFTSDNGQSFRFNMAEMGFVDETWLVYYIVGDENTYVADDWTVLLLGEIREDDTFGYINGLYIDERGILHGGFYSVLADDLVRFEFTDGYYRHFDVKEGKFVTNTDECIVRDGVLLAYQGPSVVSDFTVPDGVTAIGANAFAGVYTFGSSNGKLDLNGVERIEDYAFYGIHTFGFTSVSSDKVTYVGNYAFYVSYNLYGAVTEDNPTYWIFDVNLPNAEYIGNYAFNGNNQMNNGVTKLNKVTYIGYAAFSHNFMSAGQYKMVLDLTDADISAIQMDKNAFLPGPNGTIVEGLPVIIWVRDADAMEQAQAWDSAIYDCVVVKEASVEGVTFVDFDSRNVLQFGALTDNGGKANYYVFDEKNGYSLGAECNYSYIEYGVVRITFNGADYEFDDEVTELQLGSVKWLRAGAEHTFDVTEEDGGVVKFRFTFGIDVSQDVGGLSVSMNVLRAVYDSHASTSAQADLTDFTCAVSYVVGEETINTEVNMSDWTSTSIAWGITVYTQNGDYRALLEQPLGDGYYYLSLEALVDGNYVAVEGVTDIRRSDIINVWTCTLADDESSIEYTITFEPSTQLITVSRVVTRTVQVAAEGDAFRATIACDEDGNAVKLLKLEEYNAQYKYYDTVYNYRDPSFGVTVVLTAPNTFTVTNGGYNGRTVWTVTFVGGDTPGLTVTKVAWKAVTVVSEHVDDNETGVHQDYYNVVLYVDSDGNVVGIYEVTRYMWNNGNNFYDNEVAFTPSDVTRDGDAFVFTHNGTTYRLTATSADGTYSVTVTTE